MLRGLRTFALLASALLLLSACYLPTQFTADIRIDRTGAYSVDYVGRIANAPLLGALQTSSLSPDEERERVDSVVADLRRDSGFSDVQYVGGGVFEVSYHRTGNLDSQPAVTFVRNDSRILTITYLKDAGTVTVTGGTVPLAAQDRVRALNIDIRGVFRVHTDLAVRTHNATSVTQGPTSTYAWVIAGFDGPAPKLVIQ